MGKKEIAFDKKTVMAAMLVVSLVMAFLPWISMRIDFGVKGVHTLKQAYAYSARESGIAVSEVRKQTLSSLESMIDRAITAMKDAGVRTRLTGKQYVRTYKHMEDGLLSPNELGGMTVTMSRLYKMELDYYKSLSGGSYGTYNAKLASVRSIKSSLTAAAVLLWIGMLLMLASFLLACWGWRKGDKRAAIPYAALWLLLCIYVLIVVGKLNTPELAQMWPTTLNGSVSGEVKFRFMVWPIIGMLLAAGCCVAGYLPDNGKSAARTETGGWRCPACGAMCDADAAFCTSCGAKRPQPRFCPACGAKAPEDGLFCENCGARLDPDNSAPVQEANGNY